MTTRRHCLAALLGPALRGLPAFTGLRALPASSVLRVLPALPVLPALAAPPGPGASARAAAASTFASNFDGATLRDQEGRPFVPSSLAGRTVLYHFVFTGCSTVCPVQTQVLAQVQRGLARPVQQRVHFVSVSLDPLADTPAVLKAYALRLGANLAHWSFVTGRPEDIERVADRLRLFAPGPDARRPDDHTTSLWVADRQGQLRQRYPGNPPDRARLVAELTQLDAVTQG